MTETKIKVLVAEDSAVMRMFLIHLLESDPQIQVIGEASDGQAALAFVQRNKPDVVLMDIHMPRMDGFEATRRIMESHPLPIIICSAIENTQDLLITFQAMQAGAIACIAKPLGRDHSDFETQAAHLLETVKLMSEVKVVHRPTRSRQAPPAPVFKPVFEPMHVIAPTAAIKLIGIGASTGGPAVLHTILAALPKNFSVPILVVQHIAQGFLPGMAEWLNQTTALQVQIASFGVVPLAGHVYLAPDHFHMGIDAGGVITLTRAKKMNQMQPSVSFLFRSLADVHGPNALGVLLTGMGKDGAAELKLMKDKGAITIAQDRESSVVHGMAGEAIALGGATHVLAADKIACMLIELIHPKIVY